jgi:small-conductance mechanosensitive channel/DNA-binding transcriptional regulator YdaS (Cro superfamily)
MPTIDATQVAADAIQLNQRLRSLPESLVSNASLTELDQRVNALRQTTSDKAQQTEAAIQSDAIFTELQQASLDWEALNKESRAVSESLTKYATGLDSEIQLLKNDQVHWATAREAVTAQQSPPELIDLTNKVVVDIDNALTSAEERRSRIVIMQQSLATQITIIARETEQLAKAKAQSQRSLLERDSLPLWRVQFGSAAETSVLRSNYQQDTARLKTFIYAKRTPLVVVIFVTIVALAVFIRLSRANAMESDGVDASLIHRPFSLALLVFLVAMMPLLYDAPNSAIALVNLIGIVPVIRLLKPRLTKTYQRLVLALIVSVLAWPVVKLFQFPTWLTRNLLALLTVCIIASFIWLGRRALPFGSNDKRGLDLTSIAIIVGLFLLLIALFANVFGYVGLADLLTQATLVTAYRAVIIYTVFVIAGLVISWVLKPNAGATISPVQTDRERLARRLTSALAVIAFVMWIHSALKLFAVREDVYGAIRSVLNYSINIGSASFKIGNIVAFVLTLVCGYLVASVTRAILGEAILPRMTLARGLPNAIATVTHYVLLVLIFVLALAAAGVELSKFTLLTGAFGVGIGFGLQNVVNNFVSGLILLFERPVRVGDILEVKGVGGEVTKIGFRSSTVHAFDGSDLIIPNATLISEQVTNWTLTGTRRRITLNIHVAYGNDPTTVRDLLSKTAAAHPDVLTHPKPTALFLGFGDSVLKFELRFWAPRPGVVAELRSEVALNIAAALNEAGIKVPAPQPSLQITGLDQRDNSEHASAPEAHRTQQNKKII